MSIGELARRTGLSTPTIRFYEGERLVAPRERRGGRRVYGDDAVARLQLVSALQLAGFTLREIRELLGALAQPNVSRQWHERAHRKLEELDQAARRMRDARRRLRAVLACNCDTAATCDLLARASRGASS
jgi:DNA-binding transcriptional MerR regulator